MSSPAQTSEEEKESGVMLRQLLTRTLDEISKTKRPRLEIMLPGGNPVIAKELSTLKAEYKGVMAQWIPGKDPPVTEH